MRGEANFGWLAVVAGSLGRWGSDSLGQRAGDRVLWVAEQGIGSGGLELLPVATGCLVAKVVAPNLTSNVSNS